jgi:hypothetical protein
MAQAIYAPISAKQAAEVLAQPVKPHSPTVWQIFLDRIKTSSGIKDIGKIFNYGAGWVKIINPDAPSVVGRAGDLGWTVKNAAALSDFIKETTEVVHYSKDATAIFKAKPEGYKELVMTAVKKALLSLTGFFTYGKDFIDVLNAKVQHFPKAFMQAASKFNFTALFIGSSWRSVDAARKIHKAQQEINTAKPEAVTTEAVQKLKTLNMIDLARYVSYVVLSTLMLGVTFAGAVVAPAATLACVSSGLVLGIIHHFYGRYHNVEHLDRNYLDADKKYAQYMKSIQA